QSVSMLTPFAAALRSATTQAIGSTSTASAARAPAFIAAIATSPEPQPRSSTLLFATTRGSSSTYRANANPPPHQLAQYAVMNAGPIISATRAMPLVGVDLWMRISGALGAGVSGKFAAM